MNLFKARLYRRLYGMFVRMGWRSSAEWCRKHREKTLDRMVRG